MKTAFLTICAIGCLASASAFKEEVSGGKLYPSLMFASIGWGLGFLAALIFWRD